MQTRLAIAFDENLNSSGNKGKRPAMASDDKRLTILSIDGGGVRGIIPAKILQALAEYLQVKFFGAHPAQKCRFFTHPTHQKTGNSSMFRLL